MDALPIYVGVEGGKPWIGGNPCPDAKTGVEIFASITLSWGRHDAAFYALKEYDLGVEGDVRYNYEAGWAELSPVARTVMEPKPYWPKHQDKLRFQSIFFATPDSAKDRKSTRLNSSH